MTTQKAGFNTILGGGLIALLVIVFLMAAPAFAQGPGGMMGGNDGYSGSGMMNDDNSGSGMMGDGYTVPDQGMIDNDDVFGQGMMNDDAPAFGAQMGYTQAFTGASPYGSGMMEGDDFGNMMGNGFGGMMGGNGFGGMMGNGFGGMMGNGYGGVMGGNGFGGMMGNSFGNMMSSFGSMFTGGLFAPEPLTLAEATDAVESYLNARGDDNLTLKDVMVFDNHAYAQIVEKDSGIGAMEVLVDPVTKSLSPEMGPNMMWNRKYGMMGGMMNGFNYGNGTNVSPDGAMLVSPADAAELAQSYLDAYVPGNLQADDHADPFYGYYTLHVLRDGETAGMLSVNGYTGQVFLHTWHGDLLDMSEE